MKGGSVSTLLDVLGACLVVAGVALVVGAGVALIVAGLACLAASFNLSKGRTR